MSSIWELQSVIISFCNATRRHFFQTSLPRQFSPPIQQTDFPTRQLRLEFDQTNLPYYTEIGNMCWCDAITYQSDISDLPQTRCACWAPWTPSLPLAGWPPCCPPSPCTPSWPGLSRVASMSCHRWSTYLGTPQVPVQDPSLILTACMEELSRPAVNLYIR